MTLRLISGFLCGCAFTLISSVAVSAQAPPQAQPQPEPAAGQTPPAAAAPIEKIVPSEKSDIVVKATRITTSIRIDGHLDDEVYQSIKPIAGFFQQEPREGTPSSEPTDVWILFDDRNLYISARCWDSEPEREIATEMRRDTTNIFQNDSFTVVLDTFHDLRNGFFFQTNPLGAIRDQAIVDNVMNESWNTVWEVRANRDDKGYTVEMEIPFKSLRYPESGEQVWGINFRRVIKWKNEFSYLTNMPRAFGTGNAVARMGSAATLVGLQTPGQSKNLELKPYVVSSVTTNRTAATPFDNDPDGNVGFDFKYGITRGLIADATVNTDFAQVEEDQQQVNLTRFSLFFPEKREFFLEGQGIFSFGGVTFGNTGGNPGDVPVMFFSRQIGLSRGQDVPVIAGGRLAGRNGAYSIGALNIQTDDKPAAGAVSTNFTAVRVKRDILRRSNVGFIATNRSPAISRADQNVAFGADTNLFLFANVTANAYYARTDSPGRTSGQNSYRGRFDYAGDRYGMNVEHLLIGNQFNPEVGYVRRIDFRRSFGQLRFSPRPRRSRVVRKYSFTGSYDYVTNASASFVQDKELRGVFNTEFQSGDTWSVVDYTNTYELVTNSFEINPGTIVPRGGYNYQNLRTQYTIGQQRKISGRVSAEYGSLYDGHKTATGYSGRIGIVPQFAIEPSIDLNWVSLPNGDFSAPVVSSRFILTPNPRMAISSLIQYNGSSRTLSSSVRFRWEYPQPERDLPRLQRRPQHADPGLPRPPQPIAGLQDHSPLPVLVPVRHRSDAPRAGSAGQTRDFRRGRRPISNRQRGVRVS